MAGKMNLWNVRRIDKAGVYDPFKSWLVKVEEPRKPTEVNVVAEVNEVKQLVRKLFDDEYEPLEDDNWELTVEIVEFEYGSRVAVL